MQIIIVLTVSYCDIYIFYQNIITINPDNKHIQTMNIFEVDLKVSLEELIWMETFSYDVGRRVHNDKLTAEYTLHDVVMTVSIHMEML